MHPRVYSHDVKAILNVADENHWVLVPGEELPVEVLLIGLCVLQDVRYSWVQVRILALNLRWSGDLFKRDALWQLRIVVSWISPVHRTIELVALREMLHLLEREVRVVLEHTSRRTSDRHTVLEGGDRDTRVQGGLGHSKVNLMLRLVHQTVVASQEVEEVDLVEWNQDERIVLQHRRLGHRSILGLETAWSRVVSLEQEGDSSAILGGSEQLRAVVAAELDLSEVLVEVLVDPYQLEVVCVVHEDRFGVQTNGKHLAVSTDRHTGDSSLLLAHGASKQSRGHENDVGEVGQLKLFHLPVLV